MSDLYTKGDYLGKNPNWHAEDSPWKAEHILQMIKKNNLEPDSICEVGCGAGAILTELYLKLADHVFFTGYEISPQAYEIAKDKTTERLQFHLKNFLQDTRDFFDLLLVIDVIEHVEDYFGFLRAIKGRARYKIFHIPLDISVLRVLLCKPIFKSRQQYGHIHYFTKETALATLEDTGYEIIDYFFTGVALEIPQESIIYSLGKWPLRLALALNKDMAVRILGGHSLMVLCK